MLEYLRSRGIVDPWETTERFVVGVTPAPGTDHVIRRAARLAARAKGDLFAVNVVSHDGLRSRDAGALDELRRLVRDVGGEWHDVTGDDPASALMEFARGNHITQIVLGSSRRSRWEKISRGSVIHKVLSAANASDVDVHVIARRPGETAP
jgi:two-component system sensor histidine kinase KdpD